MTFLPGLAVGGSLCALGVYRLVNPDWETRAVWRNYPWLAFLLVKGDRLLGTRGRTLFGRDANELIGATLQVAVGAFLAVAAVLAMIFV